MNNSHIGSSLRLYYYKARIYHPKLGRFLQTDPIGYEDQMNLYAYVGNDPVNMAAPTGMFACEIGSNCETVTETQVESGGATYTGETEDGTPRFEVKYNFADIVSAMEGGNEMTANMRDAQSDGMAVVGTLVGGVAILPALPEAGQAIGSNTLPALTALNLQMTAIGELTAYVNAAKNVVRMESALTAAAPTVFRTSTAFIRKPRLPTNKPRIRVDPKTNKPKL